MKNVQLLIFFGDLNFVKDSCLYTWKDRIKVSEFKNVTFYEPLGIGDV